MAAGKTGVRKSFVDRLEALLMALILIGIMLVAQQYSLTGYRIGLCVLVFSTLLQIAVGNTPRDIPVGRSLLRIAILLAVVALMFGIGIILAPYFAQIGR